MRAIKTFEEFIKENVVKIQLPDKSRAEYLFKESEELYELLKIKIKLLGISDKTANDLIKSCYDIIMELIRAKMLIEGYNASGFGAHEAEVSYLRRIDFKEKEVQFADQLRFFRNGMLYYGTSLDKIYAEKVIEFTQEIRLRIKKLISKS